MAAGSSSLLMAGTAFAQEAAEVTAPAAAAPAAANSGNTAWILASAALVLLMTPGLALFYGGMVRAKNLLNMLMQSFVAMAVITVLWVLVGYSLSFAGSAPVFGTFEWVGLSGVGQAPDDFYATSIPHQLFMVYQMMFAIITPALISGAVAERMKFSAYVIFMAIWSLVVYAPLAHMVWGEGGFLLGLGALDFAGGTVVHISSGISALVLAILLGKRKLSHNDDTRPHNLPMTLIGTGLLWFGWFGFNAGSAVAADGIATNAFVVTQVAAASAALAWMLIEWVAFKKPTALGFATGAVAGLVAITPAAGFVGPLAAIVMGIGVSFLSFFAIKMKSKLGYDDTLDVFGVHCVGGIFGALATGLFAQTSINAAAPNGLFFGGGAALLGKQAVGVLIALAIGATMTFLIGSILKATIGIRATSEEEEVGLDLTLHGEEAYAGPTIAVQTTSRDAVGGGHGATSHASAGVVASEPAA
ncbi:MAG TPA: ammonium transporter [Armatimonadaceae bacterium]|nr:ammonium transporter [Armatimonadaceae bacterium]